MPKVESSSLENELRDIIAKIVEVKPVEITPDADFVKDLGMDSMMALEILAAIEKKYNIQIPEDKLGKIKNFKEVVNLTKDYLDVG